MDYFNVKFHNTTFRTEILTGWTTFISILYLFVLIPMSLSQIGMDYQGVLIATILSIMTTSVIGGFYARLPLVYVTDLGMNSFFIMIASSEFHGNWKMALLASYFSGILTVLLVKNKYFQNLILAIPSFILRSIFVGIGLGIIRIGLLACEVLKLDEHGGYHIGTLLSTESVCCLIALLILCILYIKKVRYGIALGFVGAYILCSIYEFYQFYLSTGKSLVDAFVTKFQNSWDISRITKVAFQFPKLGDIFENPFIVLQFVLVILIMTIAHTSSAFGIITESTVTLQDEDINYSEHALLRSIRTNGMGAVISACLGTSPVSVSVESTLSITNGARTGLSAIVTSLAMVLALVLTPFFEDINIFVASPLLIFIGCTLIKNIKLFLKFEVIEKILGIVIFLYVGITFKVVNAIFYAIFIYFIIQRLQGKKEKFDRYTIPLFIISICYIVLQLT